MDADRKRKLVEDQETETKRAKETTEGVLEEDKCDIPELNPRGLESPEVGVDEEITGNPPRNLARHGPGFLSLGVDQRKWLRQIHHRLGHPDTETLIRYLRSTNAEQAVLEGARDFQCDACVEARKGFDLPQAGAIHEDIGFNHTLGMYGVVWTNAHGTTFEFIHVIDEGTLFHVWVEQTPRPNGIFLRITGLGWQDIQGCCMSILQRVTSVNTGCPGLKNWGST